MVFLAEFHGDMPSVCRRPPADVYSHIEHTAPDAAHKFRLRVWRTLEMKSPHHASCGAGFIVLHEIHRRNLAVEHLLVVALEKIASRIGKYAGLYNNNPFNVGLDNVHVS